MSDISPCIQCGACCASFKVSFHWGELQSAGGTVPDELSHHATPHRNCMQGTQMRSPRCVALDGVIGTSVSCRIYANRPSPCREFTHALDESGPYSDHCDRARMHHGLAPLRLKEAS